MTSKVVVSEESLVAFLGAVIKPGDEVFTFTQVYGRGTLISSGLYLGKVKNTDRYGRYSEKYAVQRPDGKRTYINYNTNIAPKNITLQDLDGYVV